MATNLTEEQRKVIEHKDGPALVVAGPGSGKTLVLTERVNYLVAISGIPPESIIVTTFTERAANELKVRLSQNLGKDIKRIQISTIHALCSKLLRDYFTQHNLGTRFEVLDDNSRKLLLRANKFRLGIFKTKGRSRGWLKKAKTEDLLRFYDFISRNDIDADQLKAHLESEGRLEENDEKVLKSYKKYIRLLEEENKIDFANIQLKLFKLINNNKHVLEDIRKRYKYILVDEYQDTSPIQDRIFRMIAEPEKNLFVVGDLNQSIYGFRGASSLNFENFTRIYPDTKKYYLNTNFRSTEHIVELSNRLMKEKIKRELRSRRRKGEKSILLRGDTADSVARKTIELMREMKRKEIIKSYGDIALLFRCWSHATDYIKYLKQMDIPYVIFGGGRLLEREAIHTMIYLIAYVIQKISMGDKFKKWKWWDVQAFQNEVIGLSPDTRRCLDDIPRDTKLYNYKSRDDLEKIGITVDKDAVKLLELNKLRGDFEENPREKNILAIFYKILEISRYMKRLLEGDAENSEEKLHNLARLSQIINIHENIPGSSVDDFLWFIYSSAEGFDEVKIEGQNTVKLMTVHKAKGLEFPVLFLCSLIEGRFPLRLRDSDQLVPVPKDFYMNKREYEIKKQTHYEEERRLFYVGITRARDNLILTTSDKIRVQRRKPARYLEGIDEYLVSDEKVKLPIENKYKLVKEIPTLTYSAINTYIDCPFRYRIQYEYGFMTPPGEYLKIGAIVHNVLQRIHLEMKRSNSLNSEEIESIVEEYWIPVKQKKKQDREFKKHLLEKFNKYYDRAKDLYDRIIAIEEPFVHIAETAVVEGRVDLIVRNVNGQVNLIDFKARESEGIELTNVDKQLMMYNFCLRDKYSMDRLIAYTVLDNKIKEFEPEIEYVEDFLKSMSREMKDGIYEKRRGAYCDKCTFRFCC